MEGKRRDERENTSGSSTMKEREKQQESKRERDSSEMKKGERRQLHPLFLETDKTRRVESEGEGGQESHVLSMSCVFSGLCLKEIC